MLDRFCGCGTTVHAAGKLGWAWIGIDATHFAIGPIEKRLRDAFPTVQFTTHGVPQDIHAARDLAARGKYHEFEKRAGVGVFLTLTEPTKPMIAEAASAGLHEEPGFAPVPRLQIVTVEQAMHLRERAVQLPARRDDAFKRAAREETTGRQGALDL